MGMRVGIKTLDLMIAPYALSRFRLIQVYRSPEHFLAVLRSLEAELTDMPLPSYDPSGGDDDHPFDVCQVDI